MLTGKITSPRYSMRLWPMQVIEGREMGFRKLLNITVRCDISRATQFR